MKVLSTSSLVPAYLLLSAVAAQRNRTYPPFCDVNDVFRNGFNASGRISYPGPRVNESYPESTWTWNRYIAHSYNVTSNMTTVTDAVDLKTTPDKNLSDPNSFPFTGCWISLGLREDKKQYAKDDGSCSTALSSDCIKEILKHVNATAQSLSGRYASNSTRFQCTDLMSSFRSANREGAPCWREWSGSSSSQFLPISDSYRRVNSTNIDTKCPSVGPTTDPFAYNNILRQDYRDDRGLNNFTTYDKQMRDPRPIIVATWLKEKNPAEIDWQQGYNFVDTKLICIPANETTAFSRTVAEAMKSGAVSDVVGSRSGIVGAALLILAFGVVL